VVVVAGGDSNPLLACLAGAEPRTVGHGDAAGAGGDLIPAAAGPPRQAYRWIAVLQFAPEPEQVVTVDEAEQGERGRQAALGAVGEDLAGAVPPRLVRLDFENGPAGQHIRSAAWQAGLGEATQLDGEHVADPVLFQPAAGCAGGRTADRAPIGEGDGALQLAVGGLRADLELGGQVLPGGPAEGGVTHPGSSPRISAWSRRIWARSFSASRWISAFGTGWPFSP
jgi:hypothetical protein